MKIEKLACFDLNCRYCDKFMGNIGVPMDVFDEERCDDIIDFLNQTQSFPICDVCTTSRGVTLEATRPRK